MRNLLVCLLVALASPLLANEPSHLSNPRHPYPGLHLAGRTLPQSVGDPEVDAVVILSNDDMRDSGNDEAPSDDSESPMGRAKSIEESLETFQVIGNGRIEVASAEPQIMDPVAFDWGSDGELWVAEMGDYPNGSKWHGPGDPQGDAGGRIKLLYDTDGDGRYETAHLFLDGLHVPTGVKAFREGVLISVAPNILYAEDTDGDHVADKQVVLYSGLTPGNQQHRANGLRWGLDHWIHLANGDSGGEVLSTKTDQSVNIRGRDFKIYPDTGGLQLISGQSQFGRSRDNWGNWFGGNNSEPIWHYVLDETYQSRNAFGAVTTFPSRDVGDSRCRPGLSHQPNRRAL